MKRWAWAAVVSSVLLGCGDDSDDSGGGTGGASSGGSSGTGGGSTGGSSGAAGSGGGQAGSGGGQAGSGGTSSGGTSSGGTSSGGTSSGGTSSGGTSSRGTSSGGTGGSASTTVACGSKTCSVPATFCCNFYNQPDQCMAPGATCGYGVDVTCDGPEDCAGGKVCCGSLFIQGSNKSYQKLSCEPSCTGNDKRVICGASGACSGSSKCGASEILSEYKDCK